MKCIALITDFGARDWYAGTMKGVILSICPEVKIVDISHEIPAGNIQSGAFALMASYGYFPKGTIFVAVVDPGVGGQRDMLAVKTRNFTFIGPDNGILSSALAREGKSSIRLIENRAFMLNNPGLTFHGRDIFAPAAAHIANGKEFKTIGPLKKQIVHIPTIELGFKKGEIQGKIVYIDIFGNAITNIEQKYLSNSPSEHYKIRLSSRNYIPLKSFYKEVPEHKPLAIIGSSGFLEISVNGGSAAKTLRLKIGSTIKVNISRI